MRPPPAFRFALPLFGIFLAASSLQAEGEPFLPTVLIARGPLVSDKVEDYQELPVLRRGQLHQKERSPGKGPLRWLTLGGRLVPPGSPPPRAGIRLLALHPGSVVLSLREGERKLSVLSVHPLRRGAELDPRVAHLALSRGLPAELKPGGEAPFLEQESTVFVIAGPTDALPSVVNLISEDPQGGYLDGLRGLTLTSAACPSSVKYPGSSETVACAATPPVRVVGNVVDRNHSSTAHRTILGDVGGSVYIRPAEGASYRLRVGAPLGLGAKGTPGRYRVTLRTLVLRSFQGGPPAVGGTVAEAQQILREAISAASRMWGQCGIHLGPASELSIEVVDPPEIVLLRVGGAGGLPASGGSFEFVLGGRRLFVRTHPGQSPLAVTSRLSSALRRAGFVTRVYRNAQARSAALPTFDIQIESKDGRVPSIESLQKEGLSSDPTMDLLLMQLDLADGLDHFHDFNAASGTSEERLLLRALSDEDPSTIELFVVPSFGGSGRIGESFIFNRGASVRNALILDRSGLRAGARSSTLAHELGHILLNLPGHPDDFGIDTPTSLMDADAADATIFGPRRLSLADCQRALRQSGPEAPLPLIRPWPLQ